MTRQAEPVAPKMTVEEFLAWSDGRPDERYVLVAGEPVRMMTEREAHGNATSAVAFQIRSQIGKRAPCHVRTHTSAVKVGEDLRYPDVVVHCGRTEPERQFITDPSIVVEVTSPSTRREDYLRKAPAYVEHLEGCAVVIVDLLKLNACVYAPGDPAPRLYGRSESLELTLAEDVQIVIDVGAVFDEAGL